MYTEMFTLFFVLSFVSRCALSYSEMPEGLIQNLEKDSVTNLPNLFDFIVKNIRLSIDNADSTCKTNWESLGTVKQVEKMVGELGIPIVSEAIAIDAFGKLQSGLFRGNMKYTGNYDECLGINTESLDFSMQYCQLGVLFIVHMNESDLPLQFVEAICVPTSCSLSDFNETLPEINEGLSWLGIPVTIVMNSFQCTSQEGVKFTAGAWIMIVISCLFLAFSIVATIFDVFVYIHWFYATRQCDFSYGVINNNFDYVKTEVYESMSLLGRQRQSNQCFNFLLDVVKGFSLYKTVPAVLSTKQPPTAITSINGMRVISMFWVMMCHTYFFLYPDLANPYDVFTSFVSRFSSQPIMNGFFSVDSFFFLSGLLVAYLTFHHMKRNSDRFPFVVYYVHRILRLTPTYMFVLFFYWFVTVHMGNGPSLIFNIGPDSVSAKNCRSYWWTNLLYINNFHPNKLSDECMGWTWYLANDMQFYVISPFVLIPLYYWFQMGVVALCLLLLASFGVTGLIAGYYGYPANVFYTLYTATTPPPDLPDEGSQIYVKPYCRISPYLVGIFLGYLLYKKFRISVNNHVSGWFVHISLWLLAGFLGVVNVYGLYFSWHGHEFTPTENVLYYMFSRFTWGLTLALVVFICHNGYGGVINRFLSLPVWIPLSRLTFNVYLVHEMVMVLLFSELRSTVYYTDAAFAMYVISLVVISYGAAGVVSVFVEYPLSNLESAVFKLIGIPLHSSTRRVSENSREAASPLEPNVRIS